ncbi:MAG: alpha/beta fold hydrolase [Glaciihabitans sp.]|nr:alpha/beta fold hydrolase [Glaciihabitans sp.]
MAHGTRQDFSTNHRVSRLVRNTRRNTSDTDVSVARVYAGDVYVRVNTVGTVGSRPFVLVPGIGVASTYFERLAPNLNQFGPVHALDFPGFGGVPHPDGALSIEEYATLLGIVIDELKLVDPVLVGHSMGTQIVTELASRRPEISTVVLIGPVINSLERKIPTQARRFAQASWHEPNKVKVLAVGSYLLCGFKWFSRILPKMMQYPIEERLPLVQARTLVIRGQYDAVCPPEWVEEVGRLLPRSRLWEIPDAAHSVMHAHAAEVARLCVAHADNPVTAEEAAAAETELKTFNDETIAANLDDADETINSDTAGDDSPWSRDDSPSSDNTEPEEVGGADLGVALKAVKGRLTETVGIFTDNDVAIAEGKTMHAEAMHEADSKEADVRRADDH